MLSIGIIWNCANKYKEQILKDIDNYVTIIESFEMDLGEKYINFVEDIYAGENMEQWKIEKKLQHMLSNDNRSITVVLFKFDDSMNEYHPFKKKSVFSQLENCKREIREKYRHYIDNYTFDIVFHATDNYEEFKNCLETIKGYISIENNAKILKLIK